jgi:hypothetical protein
MQNDVTIIFKSYNTSRDRGIFLVENIVVPLVPETLASSDNYFHDEISRVSGLGISDHAM